MQAYFAVSRLLHALAVAIACWISADMWIYHGPLHQRLENARRPEVVLARVGTCDISAEQGQVALRDYLWRRQLQWEHLNEEQRHACSQAVVDVLVNSQKARWARLKNQPMVENQQSWESVNTEKAVLMRQFTSLQDFHRRLAAVGETEKALLVKINEAQRDEAWLMQASARGVDEAKSKAEAWYAENRETMRIPLRHHVAHIFLNHEDRTSAENEQKVQRLHEALLVDSKRFSQLASLHSDDARSKVLGGDLGWITRGRLPEELMQAVEATPVGRIGPPVKTRLGWHIVWVLERRPSRLPTFAEVRHEIVAFLEAEAQRSMMKELLSPEAMPDVCIDGAVMRSLNPAL